mgnify:CR=1 FL=1
MLKARVGASLLALVVVIASAATAPPPAAAASAAQINRAVDAALARLYAAVPDSRALAKKARAMLDFPSTVKAASIFGPPSGAGRPRLPG